MSDTKEYLEFLNNKKKVRASENFTLFELYFSHDSLYRYGIKNIPSNNAEP